MTYPMMQHIPLKNAYLCQDCNSVGNCAEQCPACASTVLMNLSGVLDREDSCDEAQALEFSLPHAVAAAGVDFTSMVA
jgi:hypothetical protein